MLLRYVSVNGIGLILPMQCLIKKKLILLNIIIFLNSRDSKMKSSDLPWPASSCISGSKIKKNHHQQTCQDSRNFWYTHACGSLDSLQSSFFNF